jgi:hypothetical protein
MHPYSINYIADGTDRTSRTDRLSKAQQITLNALLITRDGKIWKCLDRLDMVCLVGDISMSSDLLTRRCGGVGWTMEDGRWKMEGLRFTVLSRFIYRYLQPATCNLCLFLTWSESWCCNSEMANH